MTVHTKTHKSVDIAHRRFLKTRAAVLILGGVVLTHCDYGMGANEPQTETSEPHSELAGGSETLVNPSSSQEMGNNEGALGEWAPISGAAPLMQVRDERGRPADLKQPAIHQAGHGVPEPWRDDESE